MGSSKKFVFKFSGSMTPKEARKLKKGEFSSRIILSAANYILPNLSNVTLKYVSDNVISYQLNRASLTYIQKNKLSSVLHLLIAELNIVDTFIVNGYAKYDSDFQRHYCPGFLYEERVFVTGIDPSKNVDSKRFSLGGVDESVWNITLMFVALLSMLSLLFKRFIKIRKSCLFLEYVWFYASYILQNSSKMVFSRLSTKFLLAGWFLGISVLMRSYSGNLKSILTTSKHVRINTIEDLINSEGTTMLLRNGTNFQKFLERKLRENDLVVAKLLDRMMPLTNDLANSPKIFRVFRNGTSKYAFVYGTNELKALFNNDIDKKHGKWLDRKGLKVYLGKTVYDSYFSSFGFSKKLPKRILENVDYLSSRYVETAQSVRATREREWKFRNYVAIDKDTSVHTPKSMSVVELSDIFNIFIYGNALASIILLAEILLVVKKTCRKKKLRHHRLIAPQKQTSFIH